MKFIAKNRDDVAKALSVASPGDTVTIDSDPNELICISNVGIERIGLRVENDSVVRISGHSMGYILVRDRATLISESDAFITSTNKSLVIADGLERIAGSDASIIHAKNGRIAVTALGNAYAYVKDLDKTFVLNNARAREIKISTTVDDFIKHWSPEPCTYRYQKGYNFYKVVPKHESEAFRYNIVGDTVANYSTVGESITSEDGAPAFALSPEVSHAKLAGRRNGLDTVVVRCFVPHTAHMSIIMDDSENIVADTILVSEFIVH